MQVDYSRGTLLMFTLVPRDALLYGPHLFSSQLLPSSAPGWNTVLSKSQSLLS
jgi:hypothetical protein